MPLKLNVGASKKGGEANDSSRGASVHLELELDGSLIEEPVRLKERIRQMFTLVRSTLTEELNGGNGHSSSGNTTPSGAKAQSAAPDRTARDLPRGGARAATVSQVKALYAISRAHQVKLPELLWSRFGIKRPDDLSLAEASRLIDELRRRELSGCKD